VLLLLLVTDAEADESKMDVDDGPASMDDDDTKDDAGPKVCTLTQVSAVCSQPRGVPKRVLMVCVYGVQAVWRAGVDPIAEDEELDYDSSAYNMLHRLRVDWPCLSFDIVRDPLGNYRSKVINRSVLRILLVVQPLRVTC